MRLLIILLILMQIALIGYSSEKWWNSRVFYQIFVRSFYDSDGDGKGDLKGLIQKLDYLNDGNPATKTDLEIGGIWLLPIFDSPSYHGYDVRDYYKINPDYGTMEDFENLIKEAHRRGIKVILDLVLNHTSTEHPWFIKASQNDPNYKNYYVWAKTLPQGYKRPWAQSGKSEDVWIKNKNNNEYYYAVFWEGMPDLNYKEPKVIKEIENIAKFWLEKGVDGFRLDAARYMVEEGAGRGQYDNNSTLEFWKRFSKFVKSIKPDAVLVGEVWGDGVPEESKYYLNGEGLDLCFDFDFWIKVQSIAKSGFASPLEELVKMKKSYNAPLSFYAPFLVNHDQERAMNQLNGDFEKMKVVSLLLLTHPGTPFIYYGEEIGLSQNKNGPDEDKRTPMQWTDSKDNYGFTTGKPWRKAFDATRKDFKKFTVKGQDKDKNSLLNHYRNLIRIRNSNPEFYQNNIVFNNTKDKKVLSYTLISEKGEKSTVIYNGSSEAKVVEFKAEKKEYVDLLTGKKYKINNDQIKLPKKSFVILK